MPVEASASWCAKASREFCRGRWADPPYAPPALNCAIRLGAMPSETFLRNVACQLLNLLVGMRSMHTGFMVPAAAARCPV